MSQTILEMKGITKKFPGVLALDRAGLSLEKGEVHALLGENGAGKSTLMKILGGIYTRDEGEIFIKGEPVSVDSVHDSQNLGISIIHQELILVPYMTIAENIFLGKERSMPHSFFLDSKNMNSRAQEVLDNFDLPFRAEDLVADLSVGQQQMVEIAKALSQKARILVMDEPTAALTYKETRLLFETIADLKSQGISIIYISHRMEELFSVTDRVTVMRDGKYIGTCVTADSSKAEMVSMMVGRKLTEFYHHEKKSHEKVLLEVRELSLEKQFEKVSFTLKQGEILGLSGIVGAGRTELACSLFGITPADSGEIILDGNTVSFTNPRQAIASGITLVPESRKEHGLIMGESVGFNMTLQVLNRFIRGVEVNEELEDEIINTYIDQLSIKTPDKYQLIKNLSGGNQQKVVIAKWLATKPRILILDEPTRGVDVGAKEEIYGIMSTLASLGVSIIMISSELQEVINMSDRVMVMFQGKRMAILEGEDINQETIMNYATGGSQ